MFAIGSYGLAPAYPAEIALRSQYWGICCIKPAAPLVGLVASGCPLLSRCIIVRNKSTSLAGPPYAAIAATTSFRHLSTLGINVSFTPGSYGSAAGGDVAVSYTHLTLPTNREV